MKYGRKIKMLSYPKRASTFCIFSCVLFCMAQSFLKLSERDFAAGNHIVPCICNARQGTLQKFLKISIKNSKCAVSNKHIQDGRPGRYENRRGSKIKAKQHQTPPRPKNVNVRDVITQKVRE